MSLFWISVGKISAAVGFGFMGSALFFVTSLPNRLGGKYIDHRFNEKLEEIRTEQQRAVTRLRSQLDQLLDRGIRANEKEFNATVLVWEKLIAAYIATNICAVGFMQYQDLNKATSEEVDSFLSKTDFSEDQRMGVISSADKNRAYTNQVRRIDISKAEHAIYEARISLMRESIFIEDAIKKRISEEIDLYHGARIEKWMNLQNDMRVPEEKTLKLVTDGLTNLSQIESMLRDRLTK
jgi:hypothetical protein